MPWWRGILQLHVTTHASSRPLTQELGLAALRGQRLHGHAAELAALGGHGDVGAALGARARLLHWIHSLDEAVDGPDDQEVAYRADQDEGEQHLRERGKESWGSRRGGVGARA